MARSRQWGGAAPSRQRGRGPAGGACCGPDGGGVGDRVVFTKSFAMFFPVSTALFRTFAARFMKPTVSAMVLADTVLARSLFWIASCSRRTQGDTGGVQ